MSNLIRQIVDRLVDETIYGGRTTSTDLTIGGETATDVQDFKDKLATLLGEAPPTTGEPVEVTVYRLKTPLNNEQIKALPTTPVELVPAPGAGKVLIFHKAIYAARITEAYTNIAEGGICIRLNNWAQVSGGFFNQSDISHTMLNQVLTVDGVNIDFDNITTTNGYVVGLLLGSNSENMPLILTATSTDNGDFTGGDPSNTLEVTVFYSIVEL